MLPSGLSAHDRDERPLPFDRLDINRYSLDHLPRSISIRQGANVWLGYDLERAKLYKAWQAPSDGPGLKPSDFVVRSVGTTWFEDSSDDGWQLQRLGKTLPLSVRYLGCSQRPSYFELTWELKHGTHVVKLFERVPRNPQMQEIRVMRKIRVERLAVDEALLLPTTARESWMLTTQQGAAVAALSGAEWHLLTLP
jgi:hypothetical protein